MKERQRFAGRPRFPSPVVVHIDLDVLRPDGTTVKHGSMGFVPFDDLVMRLTARTMSRTVFPDGRLGIYTLVDRDISDVQYLFPDSLRPKDESPDHE